MAFSGRSFQFQYQSKRNHIRVARWFFSNQKYQFGYISKGQRLETVDILWPSGICTYGILKIFYDHLLHFVSFGTFVPVFGIMYHEKSGSPDDDLAMTRSVENQLF
jgi:hypothetical protein